MKAGQPPAITLMLNASTSMLKPNALMLCNSVRCRIVRDVITTSDTCDVMPTTWA